jgi:hypothetical protein
LAEQGYEEVKGIFIPAHRAGEYREQWAASGTNPVEVVTTFANLVALFESEESLALGKMFATGAEEDESKLFPAEEASLVRELAEPKPKTLTAEDYERRYQGYDWLLSERVIANPRSKAAHKAWTTTRFWESEALKGNYSHNVLVTYTVTGQTFFHGDVAVCEAHARSVAQKATKKITRDLYPADWGKRGGKPCRFKARMKALDFKVEIVGIGGAQ